MKQPPVSLVCIHITLLCHPVYSTLHTLHGKHVQYIDLLHDLSLELYSSHWVKT